MADVILDCELDPPLDNWNSKINCRTIPMLISGVEALAEYICDNPPSEFDEFIELTDTPASYAGSAGMSVVVNATEDALEFATITTTDELVKVSANDTTSDYLFAKLAGGTGISLVETNDGGDEDVTITATTTLEQARANGNTMTGGYVVAQTASTGTPIASITVTGGAHTALTASTEYTDLQFNLARTIQFATGALVTQRSTRFRAPTLAAVAASTITNAINVEIDTPIAGTNATLTNAIGLRVNANAVTHVPAVFNGFTGQTGRLVNFQVNGTTLSGITAQGYFHYGIPGENSVFSATKAIANSELLSVAFQGATIALTSNITTNAYTLRAYYATISNGGTAQNGLTFGGDFSATHQASGTGNSIFGVRGIVGVGTSATSNTAAANAITAQVTSGNATFHMGTFRGFYLFTNSVTTQCTTAYGLFMDSVTSIATLDANSYAISTTDGIVVFNESGHAEADVRMEGDSNTSLFHLDASADTVQINSATTADSAKFYVNGKISTSGELEVNGDLNHDGTNVGFYGTAPAAQSATYSGITNVTPDRAYDADTVLIAELADVVGTLIADLRLTGIIG